MTWGADFLQKVLISGLGTLGSLVIALLLFWLGRRSISAEKAREDAAKALEKEGERFRKAATQLLAHLTEFLVISSEPVTPAWQERFHDNLRRLAPLASEAIYQFRGTPLNGRIREFLALVVEVAEGQLKDAQERMRGEVKENSFAQVLSAQSTLLNRKALRLHADLLIALEAIDRVEPTVAPRAKRRRFRRALRDKAPSPTT